MAKARSPSYPAIGLKDAIEKVIKVYERDYQNAIPRGVVATHMGYESLNGKSLGVLAACLKYGLLEGRGDNTRVSDLAVAIIAHPPGSPERTGALKTAATAPDLFSELDARFQNGKASDQAIRSYLLTQKFIPQAADAAVRSYRDTKQLVDSESGGYVVAPKQEPEMEQAFQTDGDVAGYASVQQVAGQIAGMRQPDAHSASTPLRVVMNGHRLDIQASVDLEGLKMLRTMLEKYQGILEMMEPEKKEAAN